MTTQRIVQGAPRGSTLADVLDRVLDKGVVVAGDIKIKLLDVELLTIQVRLVVCSVDKAAEMGIDFWRSDPHLSSLARREPSPALAPPRTTQEAEGMEARQPVVESP